ncbi:MAG: sulfatase [Planctomycetota bacterium]|jgi:arylsulfatase A-like enzyme|nr:sulfatase [Planctomycetota bacterium]
MHDLLPRRLGARSARFSPALGLGLALCAGCFGGDVGAGEDAGDGILRRLTLTPAGAADGRGLHAVQRHEVSEDGQPWIVHGGHSEPRKPRSGADVERILVIYGHDPKSILIPGHFPSHSFNRVAVKLQVSKHEALQLQAIKDGRVVFGSLTSTAPASINEPAIVLLDLPQARRIKTDIDTLRINIVGHSGQAAIHWIEVLQQPISEWLPDPEQPPRLVDVGPDARRALGLSSRRPLEGRFEAAGGEVLSFSYGVPERLLFPGRRQPRLRLILGTGEARRVEEWPLQEEGPVRWHEVSLPLADLAPGEVPLRFEIDSLDQREALCAVANVAVHQPSPAPRTVLLVTSDTHRADHIGAAPGARELTTPNLDALAQRGLLFEDCFSSTNVTNPSHVALMTATHPRDTGILNNTSPLRAAAPTLAERFHEAGFATFAVVSAKHLGAPHSGLGQGFDRMSWPAPRSQRDAEDSIDILEDWIPQARGRPLFVWLHVFDAHTPYDAPLAFERLYYPDDRDPFRHPGDGSPTIPPNVRPSPQEGIQDPAFGPAIYRAEVSYLDSELGRVLDADRFRGAMVAVTSDHGESLGEHGIFYEHGGLYPQTIHVPLLLEYPGGPRGALVERPVRQIDVGRTLLDLAGLADVDFPGQDLREALAADAPPPAPRFTLAQGGFSAAVTTGDWHLLLQLTAHGEAQAQKPRALHQVELFRLSDDPDCERNLLDEEPERVHALRTLLLRWLASGEDRGWAGEGGRDPELLAQLADLGYTTSESLSAAGEHYPEDCTCEWCVRFD